MKRSSWLLVTGAGLLLVVVLVSGLIGALGWGRGPGSPGWGPGQGMMGGFGFPMLGMMGMMGFGAVVFWITIVGGGIWLAQSLARNAGGAPILSQGESPLDVLNRRYSSGAITKEQFEATKRVLEL